MVDISVNVVCGECGGRVNADFTGEINVDPCDTCMEAKYNEGHSDGREEATEQVV